MFQTGPTGLELSVETDLDLVIDRARAAQRGLLIHLAQTRSGCKGCVV